MTAPLVRSLTVGPFEENCWLVADEATRRGVLVDPGDEGERLVAMVREAGVTLEAIWLTHAHVDHVGGIAAVKRHFDVPVHLHPLDGLLLAHADRQAAMYGIPFEPPPPADRALADGEELRVGAHRFRVLHAPGHSPGLVAFVGEGLAFVGDLIFAGSIGRTDLPFCDPAAMWRSLTRATREIPPATALHPGHGPSTTMAAELRDNPFLNGGARPLGAVG